MLDQSDLSSAVAVIGMSGRFPGANNLQQFWQNLIGGVDSITRFEAGEVQPSRLEARGIQSLPNYVRARGILEDVERFDAAFFGIAPREAGVMDPQHRLLLEAAWEALEDAGYDAAAYAGTIGVWATMSNPTYYLENVLTRPDILENFGYFQAMVDNERDYLATRISYKLDLRGPSVSVFTACSSSLVAVCQAFYALQMLQCDVALVGGASVIVPQRKGHLFQEGAIGSKDGSCRPFDAQAAGTVFSDGVGIVVLKRFDDAVADRDNIYCVIRGVAVNNDGGTKVSYTAPSVNGQAEVIELAHELAAVDPGTITYVEAHGTATPMGDPIEVTALTQAFRRKTEARQYCALGSVKSNIGHLDAAAGIAGLIKTALALQNRIVPPTAHFESPNPDIDFARSPFFVTAEVRAWNASPRRAGVSSFGIGGTNAHVVLEEAPPREHQPGSKSEHLLVLSAKTASALDAVAARLAQHLRTREEVDLADVAYTLQVGRRAFEYRRALACSSVSEAVAALESKQGRSLVSGRAEGSDTKVAFLFSGQGSQYVGMAAELYRKEPVFAAEFNACANALEPVLGQDIRTLVFAEDSKRDEASGHLNETAITQPALFAVELALARLWMSWGIEPSAMIGHSLGEYVAACIAGVFVREQCLAVVASRGRIMQAQPRGAMLAVRAPRAALEPLLEPGLVIAALNAPLLNVVSGPEPMLKALEARLVAQGFNSRILATSHAFHSPMMDGALEPFREVLRAVDFRRPSRPWISCVTGDWVTAEQATDPEYWVQQLRQPVRFSEGVQKFFKSNWALLEVGPGHALATLVRLHTGRPPRQAMATSLERDAGGDVQAMLTALGGLWVAGAVRDWSSLHRGERCRRVALPTYPFERKRFWIEPGAVQVNGPAAIGARGDALSHAAGSENAIGFDLDDRLPVSRGNVAPVSWRSCQPSARSDSLPEDASPEARYLTIILRDLLGVRSINIDDNFFDLGGESLSGIQLLAKINAQYAVNFELKNLMQYPTVRELAEQIEQRRSVQRIEEKSSPKAESSSWSPLAMIVPGGNHPPLYCVAGLGGTVMELRTLGSCLGPDVPFYGLETRGVAGHEPLEDIGEMARENLLAVRAHQSRGPYFLSGYSAGGTVAFEMAKQLEAAGEKVALLAFIDSSSPTLRRRTQLELRKAQLLRILREPAPNLREIWTRQRKRLFKGAEMSPFLRVECATIRAFYAYRPSPYAGNAVLYRTYKDDYVGDIVWTVDEYNGWRDLILGEIEVQPMPGMHLSICQNPAYASVLGVAMRRSFEAALRRS